jgi:hypothetical protein
VHHHLPQVRAGDTSHGIAGLLAYPLAFGRFFLRGMVLDLRLPKYALDDGLEEADASQVDPGSHANLGLIKPTHYLPALNQGALKPHLFELAVPAAVPELKLALWRYPSSPPPTAKDGMCKSVLLIHAFGQSALTFAEPSLNGGLAQQFVAGGWDVWLLENRISTGLDGHTAQWNPAAYLEPCRRPHNMDQIAGIDIPAAVEFMRGKLKQEANSAASPKVFAFAQCVGSASLAMSILAGKLHTTPAQGAEAGEPMLAGAFLSQFHPYTVAHADTQARTSLPAFLRDVLRLGGVNFSTLDTARETRERAAFASGGWPAVQRLRGKLPPVKEKDYASTLPDTLIDLIAAQMPPRDDEVLHERKRPAYFIQSQAEATGRRIVALEAQLFAQANLRPETFRRMPILFGHASLEVFDHARRCVEYERLVDVEGRNVYVTYENIRKYLTMPLGLLHGKDNRLFAFESAQRTAGMIAGLRGDQVVRDPLTGAMDFSGGDTLRTVYVDGMGHLDCLIGRSAATAVLPKVVGYFDDVFNGVPPPSGATAAPPTSGQDVMDNPRSLE